jgi:hypothetical protein
MSDDNISKTNGIKNLRSVTLWLPPETIQAIDDAAVELSRGASQVTRASLLRHWIAKGLKDAKRAR